MCNCIILRGVPGSGKSTIAKSFVRHGATICSADDFHMIDGEYKFNPKNMGYAHIQCRELARMSMMNREKIVIIDNTNVLYSEMKPYIEMANEYGYNLSIVEAPCNNLSAQKLFDRNIHGVQLATIEKMKSKFTSQKDVLKFIARSFPELKVLNGKII